MDNGGRHGPLQRRPKSVLAEPLLRSQHRNPTRQRPELVPRSHQIFGVNVNVSSREKALAALYECEALLLVATEDTGLGIFEWQADTDRVLWENDRLYEIFGRSRDEGPLTKSIFLNNYLDHRDAPTFEPTLLKSIECGRFNATCRIHRNDGVLRWLQLDGRFHQPLPRGATLFLGVVADITERKLLEKRADDLAERLLVLQEEERRLIAQELDDLTAQHLVAASFNITALRSGKKKRSVKNRLWNDVETAIEEALNELRSFCYPMHPPCLDADGFSSTLRRYANGFADRTKIRVSTRLAETAHAPLALKRGLLRIVQEALANVHRHARASSVHIDLRCIAQCMHLSIIDDGVGMALTGQDAKSDGLPTGVGLQGILARTQHLSGEVRIRSDSHGTTLHVAVPLIGEATQGELLTG